MGLQRGEQERVAKGQYACHLADKASGLTSSDAFQLVASDMHQLEAQLVVSRMSEGQRLPRRLSFVICGLSRVARLCLDTYQY